MKRLLLFWWLPAFLFLTAAVGFAQNQVEPDKKYIKQLITQDSLKKANELAEKEVEFYLQTKNYDSLVGYIDIVGSIKLNLKDQKKALVRAKDLVDHLFVSENPYIRRTALVNLAWLETEMGLFQDAYNTLEEALNYAKMVKDYEKARLDRIEHSMGNAAYNLGKYDLAKKHYQQSLNYLTANKPDNYESIQASYNSLGTTAWMEAKMDSCAYYFERALEALSKADSTDLKNRYYRPAMINSNLSIVMNAQGNSQQAIEFTERAIENYGTYYRKVEDDGLARNALKNQLSSIANLGSFYGAIGNYKKGLELIEYAHKKKQTIYSEDEADMIFSWAILSQIQISNLLFDKAVENTATAIRLMAQRNDVNPFLEGSIYYTRGAAFENLKNPEEAAKAYQKGEDILRETFHGNYNMEFIDQLIIMSLFYANNGYREKAIELADEIYAFGEQSDFKNTLQHFHYILNRAEVSQFLEDHEDALKYSEEALNLTQTILRGNTTTDSILFDYRRPKTLLINAKAKYNLYGKGTEKVLKEIEAQLATAFEILKQRRASLSDHQAISLQLNQNAVLYDFAKQIQLELYELNGDESYLENLINLHESELYSRIRSQLNLREELSFLEIPEKTLQREQELKKALSEALKEEGKPIAAYFELNRQWENHLDTLRQFHPKYYELRYGTIKTELSQVAERLPENSTLVRYLFVSDSLYALLLSPQQKELVSLNTNDLAENIRYINSHPSDKDHFNERIAQLYDQLWAPLSDKIHTKRVVIVPDKDLFNLSFELLGPVPYSNQAEFVQKSILGRYVVSYNFSLVGIGKSRRHFAYSGDFVAFAPGFNSAMKEGYSLSIKDSAALDKTYLTLLPQPFSEEETKRFAKTYKGSHFLNQNATKQIFTASAGDHKIIHIATHAESNNLNPELSRLIFAKPLGATLGEGDNYLYTYEIYNTNLNSDLAVLTACETGKPTYQPGEGMISLAHAFSYAGSKSILTSLWKIDEESSTTIIQYFYKNLAKGMDKDEALQKAKLTYLETAKGRSLSPQYWAGMVLMGDISPIDFGKTGNSTLCLEIAAILLLLVLLLWWYKRRRTKKS